jgi:hypothetical protein
LEVKKAKVIWLKPFLEGLENIKMSWREIKKTTTMKSKIKNHSKMKILKRAIYPDNGS